MNIGRPSIWGKLPTYGDYVRTGSPKHAEGWQAWFAAFPMEKINNLSSNTGEADLGLYKNIPDTTKPHDIPWCFVIPPRVFSFSGNFFLAGAMIDSCDKVGRVCPIVVYQKISANCLLTSLSESKNLLFWQARLLARYTLPISTPTKSNQTISLEKQLENIWQRYQPNLLQILGLSRKRKHKHAHNCQDIIGSNIVDDPINKLHGVSTPPWTGWPHCITESSEYAWFWQNDIDGGYVGQNRVLLNVLSTTLPEQ